MEARSLLKLVFLPSGRLLGTRKAGFIHETLGQERAEGSNHSNNHGAFDAGVNQESMDQRALWNGNTEQRRVSGSLGQGVRMCTKNTHSSQ